MDLEFIRKSGNVESENDKEIIVKDKFPTEFYRISEFYESAKRISKSLYKIKK